MKTALFRDGLYSDLQNPEFAKHFLDALQSEFKRLDEENAALRESMKPGSLPHMLLNQANRRRDEVSDKIVQLSEAGNLLLECLRHLDVKEYTQREDFDDRYTLEDRVDSFLKTIGFVKK